MSRNKEVSNVTAVSIIRSKISKELKLSPTTPIQGLVSSVATGPSMELRKQTPPGMY